ncbi:unnamed protein product [Dibothriocephalus latus]|uniref:Uncharacterized protein n=1 Tax=Dibothriocephalus latus TaxID=60516 RepID=A0A3P6Q132_DIBLA|nr:unnamed protein product [Dibothriocephalus latus]
MYCISQADYFGGRAGKTRASGTVHNRGPIILRSKKEDGQRLDHGDRLQFYLCEQTRHWELSSMLEACTLVQPEECRLAGTEQLCQAAKVEHESQLIVPVSEICAG